MGLSSDIRYLVRENMEKRLAHKRVAQKFLILRLRNTQHSSFLAPRSLKSIFDSDFYDDDSFSFVCFFSQYLQLVMCVCICDGDWELIFFIICRNIKTLFDSIRICYSWPWCCCCPKELGRRLEEKFNITHLLTATNTRPRVRDLEVSSRWYNLASRDLSAEISESKHTIEWDFEAWSYQHKQFRWNGNVSCWTNIAAMRTKVISDII